MKVEDLLKKKPYTYRKCKEQSYLMGLGSVKDYEILHDGLPIRKLTMLESDVSEITNLLNYSFINGVTQSIVISNEIKTKKKKDSTKLNASSGSITGSTGSINGTDGSFYSTGDTKLVYNQSNKSLDKDSVLYLEIKNSKKLVKIDGDDYLSISDLVELGYLPYKGSLVKVADLPPEGDVNFWLSSGKGINSYSNRRVLDSNIVTNDSKSYIWTSPFATDAGKRLDNTKLAFVSISTMGKICVNKISSVIDDVNVEKDFKFPMGI